MKTNTNSNSTEESTAKSASGKTTKKTTKSRSKTTKTEVNNKSGNSASSSISSNSTSNNSNNAGNTVVATATVYPSTPKTTMTTGNAYDSPSLGGGNKDTESSSSSSRSVHKNFAGFEARSVKIMWEQHDQSDIELSAEVCARLAEDASYKVWETINNIKTYARHSGGIITYDLVNEVMRDADVPPMLGAMNSDWERIDYDGSYFFFSDKILELRDEYQKDVSIAMPVGPDFSCSWPVEDKNMEFLKKYIPSIIYVSMYGGRKALDTILTEAAYAPAMGSCYRVLLAKLIQILAFKQNDAASLRCWTLLRALAFNPYTRDVDCREEYFHLAEILICQLLAPYETIRVQSVKVEPNKTQQDDDPSMTLKMETDDMKHEIPQHEIKNEFTDEEMFSTQGVADLQQPEEKIYKLQPDDDEENMEMSTDVTMTSAYFASPVDWAQVDALCETIGQIAVTNGFFQSECLHHILRRLERFFDGRHVNTEKDYNYISRAVRGLISLGEYAFREFIPFIYKFEAANMSSNLWNDFAPAALFLKGSDDIFLYEWLEFLCGADKLQPFMVYLAQYHEKMLTYRFVHRRKSTFKICPKVVERRLEWNSLAAAMCHGDDPNKALKPKPAINDYFPELIAPNLQLNRAGTIRFKFAGCRPVIIKPKPGQQKPKQIISSAGFVETQSATTTTTTTPLQKDILIARRKLLKPLTNERRILPLSSYYFARV